ncbi:MAG: aminotransferase class III-fold pyridoxal phosphate-dependent enzyme, partial [Bacteroidia bacterium]|nr:aminotransferase class III-fold pyridoxal phosphate-dependent enzyme [Bacteroidia bacterium]
MNSMIGEKLNIHTSQQLFEKAKQFFPGGVNSPVRAFKSVGGTPLFIQKGKGSRIWDADGNEYIDYCASWGPLICGHAHPKIIDAAYKAMQNGTTFGAPTELENRLAELIIQNHPYIEKIRFVSSGTEAVMSAIRLARAYTKKNTIIKFEGCYHGHSDMLLVKAGSGLVTFGQSSSAGVPDDVVRHTMALPLDSEESVKQVFEKYGHDIA